MSKTIRLGVIAAALGLSVAAHSQQTRRVDPYQDQEVASYYAERGALVEFTETASFGAKCGVVDADTVMMLVASNLVPMRIRAGRIGLGTDEYSRPEFLIRKAQFAGIARATREGCAFWHTHPDAVRSLRSIVDR